MATIASLPPFPNGWFAVGRAGELPPGKVLTRTFMGREVVLFRTVSGAACAIDPHCPHLGAHFGHGGTVEGETIRCPFHGFCFDREGRCVSTAYGSKPPPAARVRVWPLREVNDLLLLYHDGAGRPPAWEVPELDGTGWTPLLTRMWTLRGHPQETSENSVDLGHLTVVHGYDAVEVLRPAQTDGPCLSARYAMRRSAAVFGRPGQTFRAEFEARVYGLGYSVVEVSIPSYGIQTRQFVLATPLDGERIALRIGLRLRTLEHPERISPLLLLLPRGPLSRIVAWSALRGFAHDVQQDFVIWKHKAYVSPPALARGDGPVGLFRSWARQFYEAEDS